jgi:hypothetical protein
MVRLTALLIVVGCASAPSPKTVFVERKVYVFVPEKSGPPVPPGPGIAESPLLVAAQDQRVEHQEALARSVPPPAPEVVYVPTYHDHFYDPYPSVYFVGDVRWHHHDHDEHDHHHGHVEHHAAPPHDHGPSHQARERAAGRCMSRGTRWAQERCIQGMR